MHDVQLLLDIRAHVVHNRVERVVAVGSARVRGDRRGLGDHEQLVIFIHELDLFSGHGRLVAVGLSAAKAKPSVMSRLEYICLIIERPHLVHDQIAVLDDGLRRHELIVDRDSTRRDCEFLPLDTDQRRKTASQPAREMVLRT